MDLVPFGHLNSSDSENISTWGITVKTTESHWIQGCCNRSHHILKVTSKTLPGERNRSTVLTAEKEAFLWGKGGWGRSCAERTLGAGIAVCLNLKQQKPFYKNYLPKSFSKRYWQEIAYVFTHISLSFSRVGAKSRVGYSCSCGK